MKRPVQLFIHRYYENIKLLLLVVILGLLSYAVLAILSNNAESSKDRGEGIIRIVESIERETDEQTKTINRQFQALCFLLAETAGPEALKQLDPPFEEQCRDLARQLRNEEIRATGQAPTPPSNSSEQPAPTPRHDAPSPATPRSKEPAVRPEAPDVPEPEQASEGPEADLLPRLLNPILDPIRGLL